MSTQDKPADPAPPVASAQASPEGRAAFEHALATDLAELDADHLRRRLRTVDSPCGPTIVLDGRPMLLMASNDYLGLADHPLVKAAAIEAVERYGVGAGAARLISGTQSPHAELETTLAQFKDTEAALCFGSGYLANLGLLSALAGSDDLIFADRLCHASLIDGCRLSRAKLRVYRHNDCEHLEQLLRTRSTARRTLIVTDGVFSMDGDLAPLADLADLAERYEALLVVDDAHGTGILGHSGRGSLEACGVEHRLPFHMGTLGKALGTSGAYVAGSRTVIDTLMNRARSFLFTTAPPATVAAATIAAIRIVQTDPERHARLWRNQAQLVAGLRQRGLQLTQTASPIVPILLGEADQALAFARHLERLGIYAPAIRPPTVPRGGSRVRLTVTAAHTTEQIDQVLSACEQAAREIRLPQ
ncbi:MAG: 8-amino-7-oxononanoate synthase [Nitrospiraceae bacterium]